MKRGGTIQKNRMVLDDLFEDIPNLLVLALEHLLSALNGVRMSQFLQAADNEGLVQFQSDLFR